MDPHWRLPLESFRTCTWLCGSHRTLRETWLDRSRQEREMRSLLSVDEGLADLLSSSCVSFGLHWHGYRPGLAAMG